MDKTHNHEGTRPSAHVAHRQSEMNEEFLEYIDHATTSDEIEDQICRKINDVNVFANAKFFDV